MDTAKTSATASQPSSGSDGNQFNWIPEAWFCGTADQRCQHCLRPIIFAPECLGLGGCTCHSAGPDHETKPASINSKKLKIRIRPWIVTRFTIPISGGFKLVTRAVANRGGTPSPRRAPARSARAAAAQKGSRE